MSWFADFAGKAENFLNKVDQGAATALSKQHTTSSFSSECETEHTVQSEYSSAAYKFISAAAANIRRSDTTNAPSSASGSESSLSNLSKSSSGFIRPRKSEPDVDDNMLFDFLNSADPLDHSRRDSRRELMTVGLESGLAVPTESSKQDVPPPVEEAQSQVLSSLRLENQLLRSEVTSLNQEMASIIQRAKHLQDELNQARLRADRWNSDQSQTDRTLRDLRSQVDDLTEALSAKDGQLAVLKIRLDEADQLLKCRNAALEEVQKEKSRILLDHTEGSGLQSQALITIQERLKEVEMALRREQDNHRQMQSECAGRLSKMEAERQTLSETVTAAERRAAEEKLRIDAMQQQLKNAKASADSAKQELQDYKQKASRILQSKEKLISSLKEGSGLDSLDNSGAVALEVEELRHEKDLQREEIQKLQGQVSTLRTEIQDMENQALTEAETWREQQLHLEEQQTLQNRVRMEVEAELERCKQELQYVEDEHHRAKASLQNRIKDREDEIQKLRNQLTNKTLSSSSETELENRLHQLTETLIQKQTMLEALGTEKSSLVFQLERLEQQLKSAQGGQSGGPAINMSTLEGAGARQRNSPVLFSDQDSPGVYGRVRKAASTIDRFSIRLGIFLRRYPMARVFVIVYMALLHLWVMIVLLTYTPEMHSHPDGR
uniref:Golgin subfamily A member 5 n=1 Tax=Gouania willdenowi TaxID=441366 RepID=A0A8C5N9A6_GOUWI